MRDTETAGRDPQPHPADEGGSTGAAGTRPRRAVAHALGEVLITLGVVVMLFVVYQVFYTNFEANRVQEAVKDELRESWTQPISAGRRIPGDALGILYIERLGKNWEKPLVEGVELDQLARGVGHFPRSAMPGKVGNFAIAGHRATNGEPFAYLDRLRPKDRVVVETRDKWFVYSVDAQPNARPGDPAYKLVDPSYGAVVLPVPERPGLKPTERRITLVTCNPRWGSSTRMIIYGTLAKSYPKPGPRPTELAYTADRDA
ncbi:MAG: class E sortase [Sporichthyaceae bacterium]